MKRGKSHFAFGLGIVASFAVLAAAALWRGRGPKPRETSGPFKIVVASISRQTVHDASPALDVGEVMTEVALDHQGPTPAWWGETKSPFLGRVGTARLVDEAGIEYRDHGGIGLVTHGENFDSARGQYMVSFRAHTRSIPGVRKRGKKLWLKADIVHESQKIPISVEFPPSLRDAREPQSEPESEQVLEGS